MEFSWENFPLLVACQLKAFLPQLVFIFQFDILPCHVIRLYNDTTKCQVIEKYQPPSSSILYDNGSQNISLTQNKIYNRLDVLTLYYTCLDSLKFLQFHCHLSSHLITGGSFSQKLSMSSSHILVGHIMHLDSGQFT